MVRRLQGSRLDGIALLKLLTERGLDVPVIVLTGNDDETAPEGDASESAFRDRISGSGLPDTILRAVRRHRRLGQSGAAEPIVWRDPLRAFARAFARVRHSLSG